MQSLFLQSFGNQHIGSPINLEEYPLYKQNYMLNFNTKARHIILQGTASPSACHKKAYGDVQTQLHSLLTLALRRGEWSALDPRHFNPRGTAPTTHHIGGQSGPRTGPGKLCRRKNSCPCRVSWLPWLSRAQYSHRTDDTTVVSKNLYLAIPTVQLPNYMKYCIFPNKTNPLHNLQISRKKLLFTLARFLCHLFRCLTFRNLKKKITVALVQC